MRKFEVIFAQFMNGHHLGLDDEKEITLTDFSKAVKRASFKNNQPRNEFSCSIRTDKSP